MKWDKLHDEDILYEFRGTSAAELTKGRFYRGVVDGFAEFGVFITIGSSVTGLLHRSKLPKRLESLTWEPEDEVIVQVEDVRDNGNVDLNWSIRQTPAEFRGHAVDDAGESAAEPADVARGGDTSPEIPETKPQQTGHGMAAVSLARTSDLDTLANERVRLEGRITDVRQTSGPTVFTVEDAHGAVECAAFEAPGERAYPDVEVDDFIRVVGIVEQHRGAVQLETETIEPLDDTDADTVADAIDEAAQERAKPPEASLLIPDESIEPLLAPAVDAATRVRAAIFEDRPIVIRHPSTVDGVIGGAAIEHAVRSLYDDVPTETTPGYRPVYRRPTGEPWYDLGDALYDLGPEDESAPPLVLLVGLGTSVSDRDALDLLELYGTERIVIDTTTADAGAADDVDAAVISDAPVTASTLAATVAGLIAPDLRDALASLPAISYARSPPAVYAEAADARGVDAETRRERYEALALFVYYQPYDDKRELIEDLLFDGPEAANLAAHVSAQYRERTKRAVNIAHSHAERTSMPDGDLLVIDAEAATHRFGFPSRSLLAKELLDHDERATIVVLLGHDTCHVSGSSPIDLRSLAASVDTAVPDAGVVAERDRLRFLAGRRDAVRAALCEILRTGD